MRKFPNAPSGAINKLKSMGGKFKKFFTDFIRNTSERRQVKTNKSLEWYFNKIRILSKVDITNRKAFCTVRDISKGGIFSYYYDPKWKDILPVYDKFPLIIPIEMKGDGWLGLNLHYLPPAIRAVIFDDMISEGVKRKDMIMVSYAWVKKYKKHPVIKKAIKRYLFRHVTSPVVRISEDEWFNVLMLPTHIFVKKTEQEVWSEK